MLLLLLLHFSDMEMEDMVASEDMSSTELIAV
jgi:hypothetical protein